MPFHQIYRCIYAGAYRALGAHYSESLQRGVPRLGAINKRVTINKNASRTPPPVCRKRVRLSSHPHNFKQGPAVVHRLPARRPSIRLVRNPSKPLSPITEPVRTTLTEIESSDNMQMLHQKSIFEAELQITRALLQQNARIVAETHGMDPSERRQQLLKDEADAAYALKRKEDEEVKWQKLVVSRLAAQESLERVFREQPHLAIPPSSTLASSDSVNLTAPAAYFPKLSLRTSMRKAAHQHVAATTKPSEDMRSKAVAVKKVQSFLDCTAKEVVRRTTELEKVVEKYKRYEAGWAALNMDVRDVLFQEFPWPVFGSVTIHNVEEQLTRARMLEFLCHSLRPGFEGRGKKLRLEVELKRWGTDRMERFILPQISKDHQSYVKQSAAFVQESLKAMILVQQNCVAQPQ